MADEVGSGMQVVVSPIGRTPYIAALKEPPTYSSQSFGGYSTATIVAARVPQSVASRLLYATVTIWGRTGPCWQGIVKETSKDGTLYCVGPHEQLSWHHSAAAGPNADFSAFEDDVFRDHLPTHLQISYDYVQNNALVLNSAITLDAGALAGQIETLCAYSDWLYGWYMERVAGVWQCVPHYLPPCGVRWVTAAHYDAGVIAESWPSGVRGIYRCLVTHVSDDFATDLAAGKWEVATIPPQYVVTLSSEDAATFMGDSLEGMSSNVITEWGDPAAISTTTDTDTSHYLVAIGREVTTYISTPNTQSAADAALIADASQGRAYKTKKGKTAHRPLTAAGKRRLKALQRASRARQSRGVAPLARTYMAYGYRDPGGKATTTRIQMASGLPAYIPDIRPGCLVRVVGLPTGPEDFRLAGIECTGEAVCSLDLGVDSGRLDALLARVS